MVAWFPVVELTMSSEQPGVPAVDSSDDPATGVRIPRWVVVAVLLVVSVPLLMMASMMLMMGWFGLPMHGGMAGADPGIFRIVGFVPLLLVVGGLYGGYRLLTGDTKG